MKVKAKGLGLPCLIDAVIIVAAVFVGIFANHYWSNKNLTCAQAVLHNNVAKCAVYVDKDVMR